MVFEVFNMPSLKDEMEKKIMEILPSEAKFSRVEFEGPNVIIYVMNLGTSWNTVSTSRPLPRN